MNKSPKKWLNFVAAVLLLPLASTAFAVEVPKVGEGKAIVADNGTAKNPVVKYGIIINGDTEKRHQQNADEFYAFFKDYYGIKPANLYVLTTHKGVGVNVTKARKQDLKDVYKVVKGKVDANDLVYLYTTGHGAPVMLFKDEAAMKAKKGGTSHAMLALQGKDMVFDFEFAGQWLDLPAAQFTYFGDQCNSGGFAKAMTSVAAKNVLAISSVDPENSTVCSFFTPPFLAAIKDMKNDNDPKDGKVSVWEAFKVATNTSGIMHARFGFPKEASTTQYMTSGNVKNPSKKKKAVVKKKKIGNS